MSNEVDRAAVEAVAETIDNGFRNRDVAAIAACYAPGAMIYDLAPPLGHPFDASGLGAWIDTWKGPIDQEGRDFEVLVGGDLAVCYGLVKVSAVTADTVEQAQWWQRLTVCLRKQGGAWKIVHEHASVPFHMDGSFRAAIDLTP